MSQHQDNKFALNFKSYGLAIIVHLILLGIIMFNLFWSPAKNIKVGGAQVQPIQAQVIDESLLTQELDKIKKEDELKKEEELEKQQKLEELEKQALLKEEEIKKLDEEKKIKEEEVKQEKKKTEELTKQRELEEEKTQEAEKKRLVEEAKLKELAIEKEKEEEEKEKKKKEELAKKEKEEEAEKKRKLEEEKKKKEEVAKKKREDDKRKKDEAEKKRKQADLEAKLAQEQAKSQAASLFAQYIGPIRNKVTNSWIRPGSLRPGARAKVLVRVSPQGDVLTARIQAGSGDPIFDRSVINAVYKASPLPIPDDPRLYPHYRDFIFNFDPPG